MKFTRQLVTSTNGEKWHIRINNSSGNGPLGAVRTETQGDFTIGSTPVNDGTWHHIASVYPVSFELPADEERYFVVEEFPAPPVAVFTDDFESGQGEWTVGSDGADGTVWELGTPSAVGPPAAHSPTNCFATNLSSDYGLDANAWLRSPPIDLTTAGGATLNYFQFIDIEPNFDSGRVVVLDAGDGSELAVLQDNLDGLSTDWEPVSRTLPAAALGKIIVLEFRLQSDAFNNLAGWFLDDVTVTVP